MIEESHSINPISARAKACLRQCRIAKMLSGETIFDGNCICDRPSDCKFQLKSELDEDNAMFPDIRNFYKQLAEE